jgi:hypothetical protein
MCYFSCRIIFWTTRYNTPRTFRLRLLSRLSRSMLPFNRYHKPLILRTSPYLQKFGQIHYPFSYQLSSWFVWKSAPPVTFRLLALPLLALEQTFFPIHLLHCYHTRCSPIWMSFDIEQACLAEPLLAQVCRNPCFGHITMLILKRLNPQFLYSYTLTT